MKRAALFAAALWLALSAATAPLAAEKEGEDRLRRRVKRFYVLNYLNRYGEMWEMFSADLRERLGGDRQSYVKTSRGSGFELYGSRIEEVTIKGSVASVEVVIQAQLAGSLDVDSRRHRMLWRFEEGDWRYAGSVDVTYADDEDAARRVDLQPPNRAQAPEVEGDNLLPPRVRVETRAGVSEPAEAARGAEGERWDLVAVPPPGERAPGVTEREAETEPVQRRAEAAASEPPEQAPPAARPSRAQASESAELLPPEMASAPPAPPHPEAASEQESDLADFEEGTRLLRRCVTGLLPRRIRALEEIRRLDDPRLAPLMARALPEAPAASAEVFLDEIARYEAREQLPAVLAALDRDEPVVRAAAARALRRVASVEQAPRLGRAVQTEKNDEARAEAVLARAEILGPAGGAALAALLGDELAGERTLRAAAIAAGRCGCAEVAEPLRAAVRSTRFESAAAAGLHAAGRLGDEASLAMLEQVAEGSLRLPAEAGGELDGRLEARRGLALSGQPGAGDGLARLLLDRGHRAGSEDVVLVASTGELGALLSLLDHPTAAVRRRAADLLGRVVESEADVEAAREAIAAALVDENDPVAFDALLDARERLQPKS